MTIEIKEITEVTEVTEVTKATEIKEIVADRLGSRNERKEYHKQGGEVPSRPQRTEADSLRERMLKRLDKENYGLRRAAYWKNFHEEIANQGKEELN